MFKAVQKEIINEQNKSAKSSLEFDFEYLEKKLKENQIDIRLILDQVKKFQVAVPTWGVGTGGTRFARFPGIGEPQNIYDKIFKLFDNSELEAANISRLMGHNMLSQT